MNNPDLTLAAKERIRYYDQFKRLIDAATKYEPQMERFRAVLDERDRKFNGFIAWWEAKPTFIVPMEKHEKLSEMGWLVEAFEAVFGAVVKTRDDTEYEFMTRRSYEAPGGELQIEVPSGSVTCKRVPTGETKQVEVFKIECVEAA